MKPAQSSAWPSSPSLRHRPLGRASTFADSTHPQSIKSSTDDLLLPKVRGDSRGISHEHSHWHSAPLALALLPAISGLVFKDGSAVVTDVTLLALAAIFLNWSVRLPWEWYISAQSKRPAEVITSIGGYGDDTIIEEGNEQELEQDVKTPQPEEADHGQTTKNEGTIIQPSPQSGAAAELRVHELLALLACFVFPIIGAWLLHHIRAQLSRPSEGLVSNYNLTIFLLASELRPLSHLVKMIQVRTLYLQRTVAAEHPEEGPKIDLVDISSRLDELEAHVADSSAAAAAAANSPNSSVVQQQQITAEVRKSLQPDLDALNRAVRRYEKKATILSMQVESRLQDLEARMSDAITLAAAAERNISKSNLKRGSYVLVLLDWLSRGLLLPVQVVWAVVSLPASLACSMWGIMEGYVGNKIRREMKTAGRTGASGGHGRKGAAGGRGAKKTI
ncbi:MAG: hypothetical protein LQ342_000620 [Letrouitia transgressa]|nr:MAG: hypothetical protein LQ342_000620 [Letrouitia transgressa]